ncbi:MAG: Gfo/Idh/MocA family oxidoreductase [Oscillospiraceae bacterium]|nr:Gfo/Idh/MocA family oxidoreductase [Oscillospiraceae bacterium]
MGKVIKMGFVGLGRIGWSMAKSEISKYPDKLQIVAACDLIPDRTAKVAELYPGCKEYTDYAEMLKQDDIDVVYIATRSCDHYDHALMALKAGKDVVLEKPATISYDEAVKLYDHANKPGTPRLFVHQQRRFEEAFCKMMEVVASGKLGKVFEINIHQNGFQHRDDWQTIDEFGGGQLLNWGPHMIDQSWQFLGTPTADIRSYLFQETAGGNCEDHLGITLVGNNDRVVNMYISGATALRIGRCYEAFGNRGAAVYEGGKLKLRYINPEQEIPEIVANPGTPGASFGSSGTYESKLVIDWITEEYDVDPEGDKLPTFWAYMYDSLTEGKPFPITDQDVLAIMRTISTVKAQNKYIMK